MLGKGPLGKDCNSLGKIQQNTKVFPTQNTTLIIANLLKGQNIGKLLYKYFINVYKRTF